MYSYDLILCSFHLCCCPSQHSYRPTISTFLRPAICVAMVARAMTPLLHVGCMIQLQYKLLSGSCSWFFRFAVRICSTWFGISIHRSQADFACHQRETQMSDAPVSGLFAPFVTVKVKPLWILLSIVQEMRTWTCVRAWEVLPPRKCKRS
jgi:hypothetical protein